MEHFKQVVAKALAKPERCVCGKEQRLECKTCGQFVRVLNGKFASHDRMVCMGSHIEWKGCTNSDKVI